jgi:hypothetical protein
MEQSEDLNSEQVQEIVPQDQLEDHVETEQEVQSESSKAVSPPRDHFKRLEQSKRELERELRFQKELNERLLKQPTQTPAPVQEVDEFDAIPDDDFIPKGKVTALIQKQAHRIAEQVAKKEQEKFLKQQHEATFLSRLKGQFSDFSEVVNPETLALLDETNPELAKTIVESNDPYKIGLQSYNFIKALNLHTSTTDSRKGKEVDRKLAANAKTVQSPQVFAKRPMAQAFQQTKEELRALNEEMNRYASQAGFSY